MAQRVFSIDLGSAYTKVSLRRDPSAIAELLTSATRLGVEDIDFCFPSIVKVTRHANSHHIECGTKAAESVAGNGVDVHRNWKKALFAHMPRVNTSTFTPEVNDNTTAIERLLRSDEFRVLSEKHQVPRNELNQLEQLYLSAKSLFAVKSSPAVSREEQNRTNAGRVAYCFLKWLRKEILETCHRLPSMGLKYEEIPARLCVPSFAIHNNGELSPGCKILKDVMHNVGWPLDPHRPFISEPYSNAIGILTKGFNLLSRSSTVDLGKMFGRGPLITVMKDAKVHPQYRALVVDVGAFTTDFAAVVFDPGSEVVAHPDRAFTVQQSSLPFAISNLDEDLRNSLPKDKATVLERLTTAGWENFRRAVYTEGKGYRTGELGVIGAGVDGPIIQEVIDRFLLRLTSEVRKFAESIGSLKENGLQELILTGGGNCIPRIREAIQTGMQGCGQTFVKYHAPDLKKKNSGKNGVSLDPQAARGSSALGASSIYFDEEFA